ncbi:J domain-containing protein [Candidatus Babeliales bacterium]|nr:J domain-containing protein [Candidatus Babeliales bacterium]
MNKQDYYVILGVSKSSTADEIKKSYRKLAMKYHPDRNPDNKKAEEKFKEAAEAYSILSDATKKQRYDQFGHAGVDGSSGAGQSYSDMDDIFEHFGDVFGSMFNQGSSGRKKKVGPAPQRGHDLSQEITLSLKESYLGCKKEIGVYRYVICSDCNNKGTAPGTSVVVCTDCRGSGQVAMRQGFFSFAQQCGGCWGQGFKIPSPCSICRGQTRIQKHERVTVTIPAGIYDKAELRLNGKGDSGVFGGTSGSLFLTVNVKEEKQFFRKDVDLYTTITLPYHQLVLGCEVDVKNIDDTFEKIKIPHGCPVAKEIVILGKGFKKIQGHGVGRLIIIVQCDIPTKLNKKAKEALSEYADNLGDIPSGKDLFSSFFKKFLG